MAFLDVRPLKTWICASFFRIVGYSDPKKAVKITKMLFQIQSVKLAWFLAIFNGASSSRLASKSLGFFSADRHVIPQVLRYTLR